MRYGWKDLTPLDKVLTATRTRATNRRNWDFDRIADMGITFTEKHPHLATGKSGFVAENVPDKHGVPMLLADSAIRGACKIIGAKPSFFKDAEDPNAFPKLLKNKADNPNRKGDHNFRIRSGYTADGFREVISAILPGSYEIRDAHMQIAGFAELIQENLGPVKGVMVSENGFGEMLSYRMVVGDNIMKNQREEDGQFLAFHLKMSETGAINDETALGLYRLTCKNGAMSFDGRQIGSWSHRTPLMEYLNKTGATIHAARGVASTWGQIFMELAEQKLKHPATDYLEMMRSRNMITAAHHRFAEIHAKSGIEPIETHYDFFNVLTRAAQDLPHMQMRFKAERAALEMFTSHGGFIESLDKARMKLDQAEAAGMTAVEKPRKANFAQQLKEALGT